MPGAFWSIKEREEFVKEMHRRLLGCPGDNLCMLSAGILKP
jgi:hypothetical protein